MHLMLASCLWLTACLALAAIGLGQESVPVKTAEYIRGLSRPEAFAGGAVNLSGVVVWRARPYTYGIVVHDGTAGIYVDLNRRLQSQVAAFAAPPGSQVTVTGSISPGGYAPMIIADTITVAGHAELPKPKYIELQEAMKGQEDSQRLTMRGVVQSASFAVPGKPDSGLKLRLGTLSGPFLVHVGTGKWMEPADLVDRDVIATGVCLPRFNARAEVQGILIASEQAEDLEVLDTPRPPPFSGPLTPLNSLRPFSARDSGLHRIHSSGVVTFLSDRNWMMLQDGTRAVRVSLPATEVVKAKVGEQVRVAGFVTRLTRLAEIEDAVVENTGVIEPPEPLGLTPDEIFSNGGDVIITPEARDYEGMLVRLQATLMSVSRPGKETLLSFEAGKRQFVATLDQDISNAQGRVGSVMDVTGVLSLVIHSLSTGGTSDKPESFSLRLRSADDLRIVTPAPWWNQQRLTWAAGGLGLFIVLLLVWLLTLRSTVRKQAKRIENDLRLYHKAESNHKAAVKERTRLAADLHDGLQQLLYATDYRLQAAEQAAAGNELMAELIEGSRQCLKHAQSEFRNVLWSLNELAEQRGSFISLLEQATQMMEHWPPGTVQIKHTGEERPVPPRAAGSLMLLFQEAVSNALHHGQATKVAVQVDFDDAALSLRIQDDGKGFDESTAETRMAEGHFGLAGMRRRLAWLGGKLTVTSELGKGTCITASVPWSRMLADDAAAESPSNEGLPDISP